jgi:DNA-binding response OmpR family regulator
MKKILVVDDDVNLQKIYSAKLTSKGYETIIAGNGNEGFEKAINEKPDLIILDIIMPGGTDGVETLQELKQNDNTKNIPVIMMTNMESQYMQTLNYGAVWYFVKASTSLDQLIEKIEEITKIL